MKGETRERKKKRPGPSRKKQADGQTDRRTLQSIKRKGTKRWQGRGPFFSSIFYFFSPILFFFLSDCLLLSTLLSKAEGFSLVFINLALSFPLPTPPPLFCPFGPEISTSVLSRLVVGQHIAPTRKRLSLRLTCQGKRKERKEGEKRKKKEGKAQKAAGKRSERTRGEVRHINVRGNKGTKRSQIR